MRCGEVLLPETAPGNPEGCGADALASDDLIRAARARECFLQDILGSLESFVTVDADWRLTFMNEAAGRLAGC